MTHLMEAIMKSGNKVATYPVNENEYTDIGQWDEYKKVIGTFNYLTGGGKS